MFKTRVALLGVLALFIASGIATSTASAAGPYWHVNGSRLPQGKAVQVKTQAKLIPILVGHLGSDTIAIICHNSYSEGATIEGQGNFQGQDKGRFVFEQCKAESKPINVCNKVEEPIQTTQTKSYLAYNPQAKGTQQKFVDVFEPQQGNTFVVIKILNELCPVREAAVEGAVAAEIVPIEKESQEGLLNFPEEPIEEIEHEQQKRKIGLKFNNEVAIFNAIYGARLATNERWGVFGQ
jgi:hypothetical protein